MQDAGFFNPQELWQIIGVKAGMQIADFGSGSGEIAVSLAVVAGPQGRVTALDVLPSAIESVQARAKQKNIDTLSAIRADLEVARGSTLGDASQDVVFMANILWQSQKKAEIIGEACRVLKPGGMMIAVEWSDDAKLGPPPSTRISEADLKKLFESAGLQSVRTVFAGAYHYGLVANK